MRQAVVVREHATLLLAVTDTCAILLEQLMHLYK
jgi:hypothetical protein